MDLDYLTCLQPLVNLFLEKRPWFTLVMWQVDQLFLSKSFNVELWLPSPKKLDAPTKILVAL